MLVDATAGHSVFSFIDGFKDISKSLSARASKKPESTCNTTS